jgi:sterol desaturase/sphingolipid hydroxylase (fatty acid hydroxylase superfamily)
MNNFISFKLLIPIILSLAIVLEYFFEAKKNRKQQFWYLQVFILITINFYLIDILMKYLRAQIGFLALYTDPWHLNSFGQYFVVLLSVSFVNYWWHRLRHSNEFCWLVFHKVHHAPQRFEAALAFYKHPLEKISTSMVSTLILVQIADISNLVKFSVPATLLVLDVIAHSNIHTPRFLGYLIQRPEMHRLHHSAEVKFVNFSNIVVWDWLFETYDNPISADDEIGFGPQNFNEFLKQITFKK